MSDAKKLKWRKCNAGDYDLMVGDSNRRVGFAFLGAGGRMGWVWRPIFPKPDKTRGWDSCRYCRTRGQALNLIKKHMRKGMSEERQ